MPAKEPKEPKEPKEGKEGKSAKKAEQAPKPEKKAAPAPVKKEKKKGGEPTFKISKTAVLAVGLKKGHTITKRKLALRPSKTKGALGKRAAFVREVVREVSGYAPYERRLLELLRNGLEKRAMKLAKKKLGTRTRAKKKFNEMTESIRKMREARLKEQEAHKKE